MIRPAQSLIEAARNLNMEFPVMSFPEDLGAHAMVLQFKEYKYNGTTGTNRTISEIPRGAITLPIPTNLVDTFDVNINRSDLNFVGGMVGEKIGEFMESSASSVGSQTAAGIANMTTAESLAGTSKDAALILRYFTRNALSHIGGNTPISVGAGTVINPHTAVSFEGMQLKNHSFSWNLAPKSQSESETLLQIQNYIRKSILPSYSNDSDGYISRSLFNYPKVVDIFFVGMDQRYFYYFKRCMVANFSCNYSGGGEQNTFLKGGKPSSVKMDIQMMETEIHTAEDYS